MNFNTPISSGQYTKLRSSSYQAAHNVSLYSNRVVFECQCDTDLTTAVNYAAFGWHNTLQGAYSAVETGQTILVSLVDDITQWTWRLRVRLDPTKAGMIDGGSVICNETDAKIPLDAYLFFIDTFEVWDCLSRPTNAEPPVQLEDFEQPYANLLPSISGLSYQYAGEASAGVFRVALSLTGIAMASGASVASWLITPRAGQATLISGSYTSAAVTFDLDPSTMPTWGETWFTVALTDSNGNTLTRHSGVQITDDSHPPDVGFDSFDVSADIQRGWTARLPAFDGVNDVLAWTLGVVWRSSEVYGNVAGALGATSNIDFAGYLVKDNPTATGDPQYAVVSQTTFDMVDVAARLANIEMQLIGVFLDPSPVLWDYITNLTPLRGIWHVLTRHSTAASLVDVQFDTLLFGNSYLFPILSTQGQNSLAVCNGIAAQVNAALEFGPDGTIIVTRDARFLTAAQRAALTTVASFNAKGSSDDCTVLNAQRNYEPTTGVIDGNGAMSNSAGNVQVFQSRAPGMAQGQAQGTSTLVNQILNANQLAATAQADINQRVGNQYEIENFQETITLEFPDGYNFFIPSHGQWYTLDATVDLVGPNGVARIIYDTSVRWLLEQVRYSISPSTGERAPQITLRRETRIGDPGFTVIIPPQPTSSIVPFNFVPPAFPGFDLPLFPPEGIADPPALPVPTSPATGTPVLLWTDSQLFISFNYAPLASPTTAEITPLDLGSFLIQQAIVDLPNVAGGNVPVYLLASHGTNSAVWYAPNGAQAVPDWSQGALLSGVYKIIRLTATGGSILVYCPSLASGSSSLPVTFNFRTGQHGWQPTNGQVGTGYTPGNPQGHYVVGTGFANDGNGSLGYQDKLGIHLVVPSAGLTITSIDITVHAGSNASRPTTMSWVTYKYNGSTYSLIGTGSTVGNNPGDNLKTAPPNFSTASGWIDVFILITSNVSAGYAPGDYAIAEITLHGTGSIPASAQSFVALSTDNGSTFAAPVAINDSPGSVGGFDVQHSGMVSFATSDQEINKATTLGGAYSALLIGVGAEPLIILIPWWTWGNGGKNTTSAPDFIYGLNTAFGGDTVWIVVGSTPTAVSPKIAGVPGVPVGPNCMTTWEGTRIAGLFSYSGTVHLMTGVVTNPGTPAIVWTDRGAFAGLYIRGLYYAKSPGPLFVDGSGGAKYSADYAVTLHSRTPPATGLLGIEPTG